MAFSFSHHGTVGSFLVQLYIHVLLWPGKASAEVRNASLPWWFPQEDWQSAPAHEFLFAGQGRGRCSLPTSPSVLLTLRWLICSDSSSNWLISLSHIFVWQWSCSSLTRDTHKVGQEVPQAVSQYSTPARPSSKEPLDVPSTYVTHKGPTAKWRC